MLYSSALNAVEHQQSGCEMIYSHLTRDMSEGPPAEAIVCKELQTFQKSKMQNLACGIKQPNARMQAAD